MATNFKKPVQLTWRGHTIPAETLNIGVNRDILSEVVIIRMPRYYMDTDFTEKIIFVDSQNQNSMLPDRSVPEVVIDSDEAFLNIYWTVGANTMSGAGKAFAKVVVLDPVTTQYLWQSETMVFSIAESFMLGDIPEPLTLSYFNEISQQIFGSEANAQAYAAAAQTARDQAQTSATASAQSALTASQQAVAAVASADASAASAAAALASQNAAKASETNSKNSETAAATSAAAALASQNAAKASETNAKGSETAAKTSETNAKNSETASAASATAALNSQNMAKASETASKANEVSAADSAAKALGAITHIDAQVDHVDDQVAHIDNQVQFVDDVVDSAIIDQQSSTGTNPAIIHKGYQGLSLDVAVETVAQQTVTTQGKNLFDLKTTLKQLSTVIESNINLQTCSVRLTIGNTIVANKWAAYALPMIKPGDTVTASGKWTSSGTSVAGMTFYWLNDKGAAVQGLVITSNITSSGASRTITVPDMPEGVTYLGILLHARTSGVPSEGDYTDFSNVQVEFSSTATPFEPFTPNSPSPEYPAPIKGVDSVDLWAGGTNLAPMLTSQTKTGITAIVGTDGTIRLTGTASAITFFNRTLPLKYKAGTQLRMSLNNPIALGTNNDTSVQFRLESSNGVIPETVIVCSKAMQELNLTLGVDATGYTLRVPAGLTLNDFVIRPQVEVGSTATPYEPYNGKTYTLTPSAPLWGLEGAKDSIGNGGSVIRRTGQIEFDGTENWVASLIGDNVSYRISLANRISDAKPSPTNTVPPNAICDRYDVVTPNQTFITTERKTGITINTSKTIYVYDPNYATNNVALWKAHLAELKAAGTPLQLCYELATPITESITPVPISAVDGTNIIFSSAPNSTVIASQNVLGQVVLKPHIAHDLETSDPNFVLGAEQGKILYDLIPKDSGDVIHSYFEGGTGEVVTFNALNAENIPMDVSVEVAAEQKVMVQGKNLFDVQKYAALMPNIHSVNGNSLTAKVNNTSGWTSINYDALGIKLLAGTYTLSIQNYSNAGFTVGAKSISGVTGAIIANNTGVEKTTLTLATDDIIFIKFSHLSGGSFPVEIGTVQLEAGSTKTAFEPFTPNSPSPEYPAPITGVNTVDVWAGGKNLWITEQNRVTNGVTITVSEDGTVTLNGTASANFNSIVRELPIPLVNGVEYTLSMNNPVGSTGIGLYVNNANSSPTESINLNGQNVNANKTFTITKNSYRLYIFGTSGTVFSNFVIRPQLEVGPISTPYEPHNGKTYTLTPSSPLYGLPGAEDEIRSDGMIIRKTAKTVLTGAENWAMHTTIPSLFYCTTPSSNVFGSNTDITSTCSHYTSAPYNTVIGVASDNVQSMGGTTSYARILIKDKRFTNKEDFIAYLTAQNSMSNPVTVVHRFATPITESLTPVPIPCPDGTVTIFADKGITTVEEHRVSMRDAINALQRL